MGERLREVAEHRPVRRQLLGIQAERARPPGEQLEPALGLVTAASERQGGDQPEGADGKRPLRSPQSVVGVLGAIAQQQPVGDLELLDHPVDRRHDARLVARLRQEPHEWQPQPRRVERAASVRLRECLALGVPAVLEHVGADRVALLLPPVERRVADQCEHMLSRK